MIKLSDDFKQVWIMAAVAVMAGGLLAGIKGAVLSGIGAAIGSFRWQP